MSRRPERARFESSLRRGAGQQQIEILPFDPFVGDDRAVEILVLDKARPAAEREVEFARADIDGDDVEQRPSAPDRQEMPRSFSKQEAADATRARLGGDMEIVDIDGVAIP